MKREKNNNKTTWAAVFTVLALAAALFGAQCRYEVGEPGAGRSVYGGRAGESAFSDQRVLIVLNGESNLDFETYTGRESSLNFKTYTPKDFSEISVARVDDLTGPVMELVQKQLKAEKTGDWSALKKHVEKNMLVKTEKFKRVLCLTLAERSTENVLNAIRQLKKRDDIFYAGRLALVSDTF